MDAVGTSGRFEISPNAVNSVPRGAVVEIDIRDIDGTRRDKTVAAIVAEVAAIAQRRRVRHSVEVINQDPPATCHPLVRSPLPVLACQLRPLNLAGLNIRSMEGMNQYLLATCHLLSPVDSSTRLQFLP